MLSGASFLSYQHAPLKSIRDAIQDDEHHIVRVNEEGTGEIYDLNLSHSKPYASPVQRSIAAANRRNQQQQDHADGGGSGSGSGSRTPDRVSVDGKLGGDAIAPPPSSASPSPGSALARAHGQAGPSSSKAQSIGDSASSAAHGARRKFGALLSSPAALLPATTEEKETAESPCEAHTVSGTQSASSTDAGRASTSGRRQLLLPQIAVKRNGNGNGSGTGANRHSAYGRDGAVRDADPSAKDTSHATDMRSEPPLEDGSTQFITSQARKPGAGELPPSPPLEPDLHQYMAAEPQTATSSPKKPGDLSGAASVAYNEAPASRQRRAPRRAASEDTASALTRPARRDPSTTSTGSTAYMTASSQEGSDDEGKDENRFVPGTSYFTAEPSSFLHPSSAAAQDSRAQNLNLSRRVSPSPSLGASPSRMTPSRRNTIGTSAQALQKQRRRHSSIGSQASRQSSRERDGGGTGLQGMFDEPVSSPSRAQGAPVRTGDAGFDEAIAKQYDQIRRERETKKMRELQSGAGESEQQAAQQAQGGQTQDGGALWGGMALNRSKSARRLTDDEPKVLIGNVIGEEHANYVLMYNMLTGIRIGVSRCQAKMKRPLTDTDYTAKHKFTFDIVGNELTPTAKYDFKFKDYAPWVFRELREHFHLDAADYLFSLTAKYILSELGSPGKSGSFFYFSRDYRFIIKTIRHNEHKFLRRILKDYHMHIKENPHTLLSRFYGLHRVKLPGGKKIHFVIMNNLFPPHKDIHETYDLKGSAIGREFPEEKAAQKKGAVLKDLNWINRNRELELGPAKNSMFKAQILSDVALLQRLGIMDYSLLIGLHDMKRGNREGLRQDALQVVEPESNSNAQGSTPGGQPGVLRREPTTRTEKEAYALRAAVRRSDAKALNSSSAAKLPERETSDRHHFIFYQDEGGFRSTDDANRPTDWIYYFGIIDTLTLYSGVKRSEHYWKSLTHNSRMISAIHPVPYGQRFYNFLFSLVKGADKSQRPRMQ